ncbi:MAG: low molecular weight phosphotyrosine protein phosphatase [Hahellaceae bacterium]|nr:low molecular weight phosphotyrosine protein phosphatase [Hahellaceae bacterium]
MRNVLFVCLGNICRSPTAEGVFQHMLEQTGLTSRIRVDSAGTGAWHVGKAPDSRAQKAAYERGYRLSHLKARQVAVADFDKFDLILAMDRSNMDDLLEMCPPDKQNKIRLFMDFAENRRFPEVPDPYYAGSKGFELVLDLVEDASKGLLNYLQVNIAGRAATD